MRRLEAALEILEQLLAVWGIHGEHGTSVALAARGEQDDRA